MFISINWELERLEKMHETCMPCTNGPENERAVSSGLDWPTGVGSDLPLGVRLVESLVTVDINQEWSDIEKLQRFRKVD